MKILRLALGAFYAASFIGFSAPSYAISAGELLEEESKSMSRYLAGLVDMLAYSQYVEGRDQRGKCIYDWYHRTEGSVEKVFKYLEKYPDKAPEAIIIVLAKRACPLEKSAIK